MPPVNYDKFVILTEGVLVQSKSTQIIGPFGFKVDGPDDSFFESISWTPLDTTSNSDYFIHFIFWHCGTKDFHVSADKLSTNVLAADGPKHTGRVEDNVVVRILQPRSAVMAEFQASWASDVDFEINGSIVKGDRKYLSAISRPFDNMLNGKFVEGKQSKISLNPGTTAQQFQDFFMAISTTKVKPNPSNVTALLELARFYDIKMLTSECVEHLKHCRELSIIKRLEIAEEHELNSLKSCLVETTPDYEWKRLYIHDHKIVDKLPLEALRKFSHKFLGSEEKKHQLQGRFNGQGRYMRATPDNHIRPRFGESPFDFESEFGQTSFGGRSFGNGSGEADQAGMPGRSAGNRQGFGNRDQNGMVFGSGRNRPVFGNRGQASVPGGSAGNRPRSGEADQAGIPGGSARTQPNAPVVQLVRDDDWDN
ncbi:BTB/POZ domain-containing protein [Ditylenchus destructor]|uniref:BTB/POZ domain-containing protein n=1 Tax=Ditylenchus destructor TaxID=166010 RepID=A0AAD4MV69_9BILA|nr:BTB/POZ domain-containing protein [Ditylenchus destructor]